jgi:hypothetical protein
MEVAIVEIYGKTLIGVMEQLDSEPSIVLTAAYEITQDKTGKPIFTEYPKWSLENIAVFNSLRILTIYRPNSTIYEQYQNLLKSSGTSVELLQENQEDEEIEIVEVE